MSLPQLHNAWQLDVTHSETNLGIQGVLSLVHIGSDLQLERLRARDDGVRIEQPGTTESIVTWTHTIAATLVHADEIVMVAESSCGTTDFSDIAIEWAAERERVFAFSLPLDCAEVLLYSDAGCITQIGQITSSSINPRAIVEALNYRRWASVVLHTTGWGHVDIVARDHIDSDSPLARHSITVGHDR